MEQRKWYFNHGKNSETFNILYDNGRFMLVENAETKKVSFGMCNCFNTLYGFPVNWSCLTRAEAVELLIRLRKIDEKNPDLRQIEREQWGYTAIDQWCGMIDALTA